MNETIIEQFRAHIARRLGLAFEDDRARTLGDVLARRLAATGLSPSAYLVALDGALLDGELGALAQELTVGETYLFRHADQLRVLAEVALPALARRLHAGGVIRILSAGCASGDEPYSIAIVARETLADPTWSIAIRAVDANRAMLADARRGRFRAWALRETAADVVQRYFRPAGREFVLDETARRAVTFEHRNLAADDRELWAPGSYDVVFCRNVIMYFTGEAQRATVDRIARALVPGGYLFLGSAETLRGLSERFALCHSHSAFYYQRLGDDGARDREPAASQPAAAAIEPAEPPRDARDRATGWVDVIGGAAARIAALTADVPIAPPPEAEHGDPLAAISELVRSERFGDALAALDRLPPVTAADRDVQLLRGVLLVHTGQLAAAETACRPLLASEPFAAAAHYALALCREAAGDPRGADDHVQAAAYLDPTFAMPHLHLGLAARRTGDGVAARRELGRALELLPRESPSRLLLFGGGFDRGALIALCRAELVACGGRA